jgi:hypothetical protein
MPTISMFAESSSAPHSCLVSRKEAVFSIVDCSIGHGDFPDSKRRLVEAWIELRREELVADWELARNGEQLEKIAPMQKTGPMIPHVTGVKAMTWPGAFLDTFRSCPVFPGTDSLWHGGMAQ